MIIKEKSSPGRRSFMYYKFWCAAIVYVFHVTHAVQESLSFICKQISAELNPCIKDWLFPDCFLEYRYFHIQYLLVWFDRFICGCVLLTGNQYIRGQRYWRSASTMTHTIYYCYMIWLMRSNYHRYLAGIWMLARILLRWTAPLNEILGDGPDLIYMITLCQTNDGPFVSA